MKQCPNPDCIIYTRLDELPDTYLRCPQCNEVLVDAPLNTASLTSAQLAEESTSPYVPVNRLEPRQHYVQQAYELPPDEYGEIGDAEGLEGSQPLRTMPPGQGPGLRTAAMALGAVALVVACLTLIFSVGGRLLPRQAGVTGASATETAIAFLRPAVNTPIAILPTIPLSGVGGQTLPQNPPPVDPNPPPIAAATPQPQAAAAAPGSPAPIIDALMCARLEGGEPVGATGAYRPADPFNLAVKATYGPGGVQSVFTRWYGPDGAPIYSMKQSYTQPGTYYAGFTLNKDSPGAAGDYRAEIYTNDSPQPIHSVSFSVIP
jgi:hypothetical protein